MEVNIAHLEPIALIASEYDYSLLNLKVDLSNFDTSIYEFIISPIFSNDPITGDSIGIESLELYINTNTKQWKTSNTYDRRVIENCNSY